jgi:hypothetical protein
MTIKNHGGVFGRNPTFNKVTATEFDGDITGDITGNVTGNVTGDVDVSSGTLTLANDQISGDKIDGGTISNFASTGIDDNASAASWTISSGGDLLPGTSGAQDLGSNANSMGNIIQASGAERQIGTSTVNKLIELYSLKAVDTSTVDIIDFPSASGFASADYTGYLSGELEISFWGYLTNFVQIASRRKYHISIEKTGTNNLAMNIVEITDFQRDDSTALTVTLAQKSGASATSTTLELSASAGGTISQCDAQFYFRAMTTGRNASLTWIDAQVAS